MIEEYEVKCAVCKKYMGKSERRTLAYCENCSGEPAGDGLLDDGI